MSSNPRLNSTGSSRSCSGFQEATARVEPFYGWPDFNGGHRRRHSARAPCRGVIVAHISNRHLDLAPVLANVAQAQGLVAFFREDNSAGDFLTTFKANARVVVLAREPGDTGSIAGSWLRLQPDPKASTWSDDYSDILTVMLRKKFGW